MRIDAQKAHGEGVQVSGGETWWDPRMSKPHCSARISKWRYRLLATIIQRAMASGGSPMGGAWEVGGSGGQTDHKVPQRNFRV